jgi:CheY-like chemotaxis protein
MAPQQTLSLITLDIKLPGIDGWEFLGRLRENAELAKVPVVIISGFSHKNLTLTRGASAILEKPISRAHLKASLAKVGLQPAHERTHIILVVDEDPKAVDVIAKFMPAPYYAVLHASDSNEAIMMAVRLRPALVVLDLMMPEMSGFRIVKALQSHADTANIPILVVTAKQITTQERAALNRNAGKPVHIVDKSGFDSEIFIAEVRRTLQSH